MSMFQKLASKFRSPEHEDHHHLLSKRIERLESVLSELLTRIGQHDKDLDYISQKMAYEFQRSKDGQEYVVDKISSIESAIKMCDAKSDTASKIADQNQKDIRDLREKICKISDQNQKDIGDLREKICKNTDHGKTINYTGLSRYFINKNGVVTDECGTVQPYRTGVYDRMPSHRRIRLICSIDGRKKWYSVDRLLVATYMNPDCARWRVVPSKVDDPANLLESLSFIRLDGLYGANYGTAR